MKTTLTVTGKYKTPVLKWTHPDWDTELILEAASGIDPKEYLGGDSDPALLKSTPAEMTFDELAELPEFTG